jgi:hypothetical protein
MREYMDLLSELQGLSLVQKMSLAVALLAPHSKVSGDVLARELVRIMGGKGNA